MSVVRCFFAWCLIGLCTWASAQRVPLTEAEAAWVASHPVVDVVLMDHQEPYHQRKANGHADGYAIDMLLLLGERAGLKWHYQWAPSAAEAQRRLARGTALMTPLMSPDSAAGQAVTFPGALLSMEQVLVSRSDVPDVSEAQNFAGRRLALVTGEDPSEALRREFPLAHTRAFGSLREALQAVSTGEADLCAAWLHPALYLIEAQLLANLRVHREERADRSFMGPAVSAHAPELHHILRKAIESLSPAERAGIAKRWLPTGAGVLWAPGQVSLSPAERAWLQQQGDVRIGFDQDFSPFTKLGRLGRFEGLGADMFRLAAQKVGLRVIDQTGGTFAQTYSRAAEGEIDVVIGMARTELRRQQFEFIGPFSVAPTVMVMRSQDPRLWRSPDDMDGGPLGLLKDHFLAPELRSRHPSLKLVEFDAQADVLAALDAGSVAAALGNSTVINRLIDERYIGRLRVTGLIPDADSELFFGVPKNKPELARLLAKGFAAVTPGEATEIQRRWLLITVQPGLTWQEVSRWALPLGLATLIVIGVLWRSNRGLTEAHRAEAQARQTAEAATQARGRFLAFLSHEIRGTLMGIRSGVTLLRGRTDPAQQAPLLDAIARSADSLGELLETTLQRERSISKPLPLQAQTVDLAAWWRGVVEPWALTAQAKGVRWSCDALSETGPWCFDGIRLGQVIGNLLDNAVKFTPQDGSVVVRAAWDATAGHLTVKVLDTGPGLGAGSSEGLFAPYFQGEAGRQAHTGAGLGLAVCKQIVDAMDGTLTGEDRPGGGAIFTVDVPLLPPQAV